MGVAATPKGASRAEEDRLALIEQRIEAGIGRWGPFAGLLIGLAATPVIVRGETWLWYGVVPLVAVTSAWAWFFVGGSPARVDRPGPARVVYVIGLLALMAALVWFSPFFGFLAIAAYPASFGLLRGHWRYVGVFVASAIVSYTYIGGRYAEPGVSTVIGYSLLAVLNFGFVSAITWYSEFVSERSKARRTIIEELDETNARLSAALEENAELHAQLLVQARDAGVRDERARMAREIHDTIAQGLTGIVAQLEAADVTEDDAEARRRHIDTARGLARESLTEARRSVAAMAPGRLAQARLPEAITEMAKSWAESSGVALSVETTGEPRPLLPDLEVALYRVAQEALANVGKHAGATRVGLTLSYMDDLVVLDVRDDGSGFDPATYAGPSGGSGFGLAGMEQRLQRVSGRWEIESAPGEGTAVSASVPAIPAGEGDCT